MIEQVCRSCGSRIHNSFVDLGMSPLCESFVRPAESEQSESFYPLHPRICENCFLVQLPQFVAPKDIFGEYAYFSSYSDSWVEHMRSYCDSAVARFDLQASSRVVEIASNDGYLLQHFVERGIPCLGVEPAANVAEAAISRGIPTTVRFFGRGVAEELAGEFGKPDLLIANNVLAHVPDLNDFVSGLKALLKPGGVLTLEFPHLLRLIEGNQFDTIYHEHFSYLSLYSTELLFRHHGLAIFDVDQLATHGGSLRIYASHSDDECHAESDSLRHLRHQELMFGVNTLEPYCSFKNRVESTKHDLLQFLIDARRRGKRVAGYGAPGKGNTLLNYCGIRQDFLEFTVDRNPYKQGLLTPGTRIPIFDPGKVLEARPDYLLILPWNLADEIVDQMAIIRDWGGQFVVPIPEVSIL